MSSPAATNPAELMFSHIRTFLDYKLTLRELAMLYFLALQKAPVGHSDLVLGLGIPDSSGSVRAIVDGPLAIGLIDRLNSKNSRGKQCWLYALKPEGRKLLRLPTVNSEPKTANCQP